MPPPSTHIAGAASAPAVGDPLDVSDSSCPAPVGGASVGKGEVEIREVWAENLDAVFEVIRSVVDVCSVIGMDTEFPGVALRRVDGRSLSFSEQLYQDLRANVDLLHVIQLGLTFSDPVSRLPTFVFQFNFREFDPVSHPSHPNSLDLLSRSGIDFTQNHLHGIDARRFAELLMSSGAVLNPDVSWVTYHGGYDFGYLLKVLTCAPLPSTQEGFLALTKIFFPNLYDLKHMIKFCNVPPYGGLNGLADILRVKRVGVMHQAGSDSLVTLRCFWDIATKYINGSFERLGGVIYGFDDNHARKGKE